MPSSLDHVQDLLKKLPGLGYRSAERIALHLLVEKPDSLDSLVSALKAAAATLHACPLTGNITEGEFCPIYENPVRRRDFVCVVECVPDLLAIERSASFNGTYHVLHGKLSPLQGIGPEDLNLNNLRQRLQDDCVTEMILALSNDVEGEVTCHYIQDAILAGLEPPITLSRIGFGLPSGGGIPFADSATLRSSLESRQPFG